MEIFQHLRIPFGAIQSATNNFGDGNCIGRGGFGRVYKGELLQSNANTRRTVAVKRLNPQWGQGNNEFWKEIMLLSSYKHENIVSLIGFCDENHEKILVYEYVYNKSLDLHLGSANLSWMQRLNICIGAARGLEYLHDPNGSQQRILHRDIKTANILLDEHWKAKISDFGLSKLGPANQQFSMMMTTLAGTPGYCDPLYLEGGLLSKESDVYSFGVVLFEVLCGRLCTTSSKDDGHLFIESARQCVEQNKLNEIVSDGIKDEINPDSLKAFATIAYQCLKRAREERPTMIQIVNELEIALGLQRDVEAAVRYDLGKLLFGCKHYRNRCKLHAPCCDRVFSCRRCHDEYTSELSDPNERHKIDWKDVNEVVCTICYTKQPVAHTCCNCGVKMGEYFCRICKLYDDDTSKGQFHCYDCGICRLNGRKNFFHCQKCGGCFDVTKRVSHTCLENDLRRNCPVCDEYLVHSVRHIRIMDCLHSIHEDCHPEIWRSKRCPICSNSSISVNNNLA